MNLKRYLFEKDIKQVDIAKATGTDPSKLSLHINGIRRLPSKHLTKISEFLGIPMAELTSNEITKVNGGEGEI